MTTNAQAALQAAAAWHSDNPYLVSDSILATADKFKDWLDDQDTKAIARTVSATQCPTCGATPGHVCTWPQGGSMAKYHRRRALASGADLTPEYMHHHTHEGDWEEPAARVDPDSVRCPKCTAAPLTACLTPNSSRLMHHHKERVELANLSTPPSPWGRIT